MERLSIQVQTAYAELLEQRVAIEAQRAIGHSSGSFVLKTLKGQEYYYYQHALPGRIVQSYVGRRSPARFALHKLVVSRSRPPAQQAKSGKYLDQAAQLIEVLVEDRPGDLALACDALGTRKSLARIARAGLEALKRRRPEVHASLTAEIDTRPV